MKKNIIIVISLGIGIIIFWFGMRPPSIYSYYPIELYYLLFGDKENVIITEYRFIIIFDIISAMVISYLSYLLITYLVDEIKNND